MECDVSLGMPSRFELKGAILVYSGGHTANGAFAAWHDALLVAGSAPSLGPAKPLTVGFLRELSCGLGTTIRTEVLPETVLVRTPDTLVWWSPARRRRMFFRKDDPLGRVSGRTFAQPALVYKVSRRELWVRALKKSSRPIATTKLHVAPYYNVNVEGRVCQGSMRSPGETSAASMVHWERAFFESEFTHIYGGGRLTNHASGVAGLWAELAGVSRFPTATLVPARESLAEFACGEKS